MFICYILSIIYFINQYFVTIIDIRSRREMNIIRTIV